MDRWIQLENRTTNQWFSITTKFAFLNLEQVHLSGMPAKKGGCGSRAE